MRPCTILTSSGLATAVSALVRSFPQDEQDHDGVRVINPCA